MRMHRGAVGVKQLEVTKETNVKQVAKSINETKQKNPFMDEDDEIESMLASKFNVAGGKSNAPKQPEKVQFVQSQSIIVKDPPSKATEVKKIEPTRPTQQEVKSQPPQPVAKKTETNLVQPETKVQAPVSNLKTDKRETSPSKNVTFQQQPQQKQPQQIIKPQVAEKQTELPQPVQSGKIQGVPAPQPQVKQVVAQPAQQIQQETVKKGGTQPVQQETLKKGGTLPVQQQPVQSVQTPAKTQPAQIVQQPKSNENSKNTSPQKGATTVVSQPPQKQQQTVVSSQPVVSQPPQKQQQKVISSQPPQTQKQEQSVVSSGQSLPPQKQQTYVSSSSPNNNEEPVKKHGKTHQQRIEVQKVVMSIPPEEEPEEVEVVEKNYKKPQLVRKPNQLIQLEQLNLDDVDSRCRAISPVNPTECDRVNLKGLLEDIKQQKKQFTDVLYPPNISAIFIRSLQTKYNPQKQIYKDWQPIKQAFSKNTVSLSKFVDPNDIQEGNLISSNPNVLSALSCLAEQPETIQYILENQTINDNGIYYVKINKQGVWRFIVVDDYFPFSDNKLLTSGPRIQEGVTGDIEIWSSIVEKALIKAYGSYENLEQAKTTINEVLRDLTGGVVLSYETSTEGLESLISKSIAKGQIVVAKQRVDASDDFRKNFSFCVLSAKQGKVEIRNPWGFESEKQKFTCNEKGVCLLKMVEFQSLFSDILVVYPMNKATHYVSRSIENQNNSYNIQKIVFKENQVECFFEFTQVDKRLLKKNRQYQYCQARLILFNEDGYVDGVVTEGQRTTTLVCSNLKPGEYNLITYANFQFPLIQHGTVSYQGCEAISFERIPYKNNPEFLNDLYASHIQKNVKKAINEPILQANEGIVVQIFVSKQTKPDAKPETVVKDFSNIKNAKIIRKPEDDQSLKLTIELKPNQIKTVLFSVNQGIDIGAKTLKDCAFK